MKKSYTVTQNVESKLKNQNQKIYMDDKLTNTKDSQNAPTSVTTMSFSHTYFNNL